jgi:hypothetical protein
MSKKSDKQKKQPSVFLRHDVELKLRETLADWKERLGEKNFNKRIRKAARAFAKDLSVAPAKITPVKRTFSEVSRALAADR